MNSLDDFFSEDNTVADIPAVIEVDENVTSVTDFINSDYRNYSLYTVFDRALPGIDGLKPTQRKLIYTASKVKEMKKTAALAGDVISIANYHHGNAALEGGIVTLSRTDNTIPILDGKGYFGNRVVPKPSAARYTKSVISKAFVKYFPDSDIAPPNDDLDNPEPKYYLPLIPWGLVNGGSGIAVGFASNYLPRDPDLLRKACMAHLMGRDISNIQFTPSFKGFRGEIHKSDNGWTTTGVISHRRANIYDITELPCGKYGQDRIAFVKTLNTLRDCDAILDYKDRCSKVGFNFELKLRYKMPTVSAIKAKLRNEIRTKLQDNNTKFTQEKLEKMVDTQFKRRSKYIEQFIINGRKPDEIVEMLKYSKDLKMVLNNTDNLTAIDDYGKVKIYDSVAHLIQYFTDFRLAKYKDRYDHWIQRDTEKLRTAKVKYGFIRAVMDDKIVLKGRKRDELIDMLVKRGIESELAESLLRMPVHSFCDDELAKLSANIIKYTDAIKTWRGIDHRQAYLSELKALK